VAAQVVRHLAELCIQAHQQSSPLQVRSLVADAMACWLASANRTIAGSRESCLWDNMREQLQRSGLLQHLGAILTDAADALTAAAAAAFGEAASQSNNRDSIVASSTPQLLSPATNLHMAVKTVGSLLRAFVDCSMLLCPPEVSFNLDALLPAAPAAVRLILTTYQTCSSFEQLTSNTSSPLSVLLLAADPAFKDECAHILGAAHYATRQLAGAVLELSTESSLQSSAAASVLLHCPELVHCMAVAVLLGVLGLDTGAQGAASSGHVVRGTAGSASSSSSSRSSLASSTRGRQASTTQGSTQHTAAPTAASSAAAGGRQVGSSSSSSNSSSVPHTASNSNRLANGISLDSLTPLSSSLLGLLGVEQRVLLHVARAATQTDEQRLDFSLDFVALLVKIWCDLLQTQVG
jgi:hypothetical protein